MAEPISTAELKTHLRVDHSDQDAYLENLIVAAREEIEASTWRALTLATRTIKLRGFPDHRSGWRVAAGDQKIYLPFPPLQSVTSIYYLDENGASTLLDASKYVADSAHWPATIEPAFGESWPATREHPAAVTITISSGYATAASVPKNLRHAVFLVCAELFENAEPSPLAPASGGVGASRTTLDRILDKFLVRHPGILECV